MEPIRIFVPDATLVPGSPIKGSAHAWLLKRGENQSTIELKNEKYMVPNDSYCSSPVPFPDEDTLEALDSCFLKSMAHFSVVLSSDDDYYRILKCREHARFFLEDHRGGVAMYKRLIFLGANLSGTPDQIWGRYHVVSDDELNYLQIAK